MMHPLLHAMMGGIDNRPMFVQVALAFYLRNPEESIETACTKAKSFIDSSNTVLLKYADQQEEKRKEEDLKKDNERLLNRLKSMDDSFQKVSKELYDLKEEQTRFQMKAAIPVPESTPKRSYKKKKKAVAKKSKVLPSKNSSTVKAEESSTKPEKKTTGSGKSKKAKLKVVGGKKAMTAEQKEKRAKYQKDYLARKKKEKEEREGRVKSVKAKGNNKTANG